MNKDRIKTELDIEEILLAKNYEDLSFREKEFVENQVDSEEEYRGLRNTLLSIKHYSSEQERIVAPARIKEELMELMEKQNKSFAWFSLEGIANWLFPSGVRLFQKPGFQIAGFAMLVLLALNIGFDFVPKKQGQLAINTIKKFLENNVFNWFIIDI